MMYADCSRISCDKQRERSIEDQNRNTLNKFAELGISADQVELFCDIAISGTHDSRPGYQRLMDAIKAGEVETLVVDDQSRLTRDTNIGELLSLFKFHGNHSGRWGDGGGCVGRGEKGRRRSEAPGGASGAEGTASPAGHQDHLRPRQEGGHAEVRPPFRAVRRWIEKQSAIRWRTCSTCRPWRARMTG